MTDTRTQKRWQIVSSLRIYDEEGDNLLGHLFDISTDGIRVISEKPLATETEYNFRMLLPVEGEDEPDSCSITARSIWSKGDTDESLYDTGFQLIDVSEEIETRLVNLIEELKATQTS